MTVQGSGPLVLRWPLCLPSLEPSPASPPCPPAAAPWHRTALAPWWGQVRSTALSPQSGIEISCPRSRSFAHRGGGRGSGAGGVRAVGEDGQGGGAPPPGGPGSGGGYDRPALGPSSGHPAPLRGPWQWRWRRAAPPGLVPARPLWGSGRGADGKQNPPTEVFLQNVPSRHHGLGFPRFPGCAHVCAGLSPPGVRSLA